jgi:hypothetical protein
MIDAVQHGTAVGLRSSAHPGGEERQLARHENSSVPGGMNRRTPTQPGSQQNHA